jgi:P27 family predicted phage terminase small subunit
MQGRKPIAAKSINLAVHKRSKKEVGLRKEAEAGLKTKASLSCPKYLSEDAKAEWRRIKGLFRAMGSDVFCDLDMQMLVMYCEATAIYKKAQATWVEYAAVVVEDSTKQKLLDKCIMVMSKHARIISALSEQLCLTPTGRVRMGMNADNNKEANSLEAFFDDD